MTNKTLTGFKRQLSHAELADALSVTMRIGMLMVRSGSASFRAEQVMVRLAEHMGVERVEAYITPTGIIASAYSGHEHRTQMLRIPGLGVDLNRIIELELLSRNLPDDANPETVAVRLDAIEAQGPKYKRWQIALAVGIACGSFALILRGGPLEAIMAAVAATTAQTLRMRMIKARFNPIPITVTCAAVATLISSALGPVAVQVGNALGLKVVPPLGVIASVLLLVPGVPLVTAILDLTRLDLVSGTARGVFALIIFTSIAIGMLLILSWIGISIL